MTSFPDNGGIQPMVSAIIVAAGAGTRMKTQTRKQYIKLGDYPVIGHTLKAFDICPAIDRILLVLPEKDLAFCREQILPGIFLQKQLQLVKGGITRQASVYNGIRAIEDETGLVVIHDGVRPFIRPNQVAACVEQAKMFGACILGVPALDTLKSIDNRGVIVETVSREAVWQAQTPQAFRLELIRKAHEHAIREGFVGSDDALLVERLKEEVRVISGSRYNIKITTGEDLKIAKAIMDAGLFNPGDRSTGPKEACDGTIS